MTIKKMKYSERKDLMKIVYKKEKQLESKIKCKKG